MTEDKRMSLTDAESGKKLIVEDFISGIQAIKKLNSLGIHKEDVVLRINENNWGPVLIENLTNDSSRVAIGRNIAERIIVKYEK